MKYCFGADVGGTTIKLGLFTVDGEILDKWEIITRTENEGESILQDIATALKEKIQEKAIPAEEVIGIGMGIPAPVNSEGIVRKTANLGWGYKEVKKELENLTGWQVVVGNDANVAALGEMWKGAGHGEKNMVMVTLGTGVGGGVIMGGRPLIGANGAGGEIGHICVNYFEEKCCGCGKKGCLEQYASATGIVRVAGRMLAASEEDSTLRGLQNITAKDVLDAFKAGDTLAGRIMECVGGLLGSAIAGFAAVVDPEAIVIGGGVSKAGQPLIDCIQKHYIRHAFPSCKETPVKLATLGNDAGIYGAAKMVL